MPSVFCRLTLAFAILASTSATAAEPSWGNLKAKIVYDGKPPERARIDVVRDKDVCGKFDLREEGLVVDKEGGLANVLVWIDAKEVKLPVHPDYEKSAKDNVSLDSRGCRFVPHVSYLRTTQTLVLRNSDAVVHNARFDAMANNPFNVILVPEKAVDMMLDKPERLPARMACNIHPWRDSYLLVQDHPYMAVSDARGNVDFANLPAGKWKFVFWHERAGYLRNVEMKGAKFEWLKGRAEIEIKPGENEFGEIKVKPEAFEPR